VLIAVFAYVKYNSKKSQKTEWGAVTEREFMKAEKERENTGKI
jgi:hypothetical protein